MTSIPVSWFGAVLIAPVLAVGFAEPEGARAQPAAGNPGPAVLRQRAIEQIERLASLRGTPHDAVPVADGFVELVDTLVAARLDSLAAAGLDLAGWCAYGAGDPAGADARWQRGLRLAQELGTRELESQLLSSLALGRASAGDYEGGIELWKRNILVQRGLGDALGEGQTWGNLANAYAALSRVPEALVATEVAARLDSRTGNRRGLLIGYHRRAGLLAELGQLEEAVTFADSAVAGGRDAGLTGLLAAALPRCAAINYDLGQTQHALAILDEAIRLSQTQDLEPDEARARTIRTRILAAEGRADEALAEAGVVTAMATRSGDAVLAARILVPRGNALAMSGRLDEAEAVLVEALSRYETLRTAPGGGADPSHEAEIYSSLGHCYFRQGRVARSWAAVERGQVGSPTGPGETIASLGQVQTRLREADGVLVQLSEPVGHPMLVFVITPDTLLAAPLGSKIQSILAAGRAGLDLLASGADDATCEAAFGALTEAFQAAVVDHLPPRMERIVWVLPSRLTGFPFEVLPLGTSGSSLGDVYASSYLPNASSLVQLLARQASTRGMVVFADPEQASGDDDRDVLPSPERGLRRRPLPQALEEARSVAIPGASLHVGSAATGDRVASPEVLRSAVLHFATHALVDPSSPSRSSLLLAGDDRLTAREVEAVPLAAELVTLSGSRPSGGHLALGEGTLSLPRAFLAAGCRSVVASLWDVEDRAARRFMEIVYGRLKAGRARDHALRDARRIMAEEGYSHRDRSGFILVGLGHLPVAALIEGPRLPGGGITVTILIGGLVVVVAMARRRARRGV